MDETKLKAIAVGMVAVIVSIGAVHSIASYITTHDRKLLEIAKSAVSRLSRIHRICMEDTFYSLSDVEGRLTIIRPYYDSMVTAWRSQLKEADVKLLETYVFTNLKQIVSHEE